MSIDLHVYDYFDMIKDIQKQIDESPNDIPEGRSLNEFVEKVLPKFGYRLGGKFVTLWNEYYSDSGYNSGSELFRAVELYFGIDDVWLGGYDYGEHANAREVLDSLDIEPIGDEDDY